MCMCESVREREGGGGENELYVGHVSYPITFFGPAKRPARPGRKKMLFTSYETSS